MAADGAEGFVADDMLNPAGILGSGFLVHPQMDQNITAFFFVQFFLCATVQSIFYKSSGNCLRIRLCMGSRIRSASPAEKIY